MGTFVQHDGKVNAVPGGIPSGVLERIENDIEELRSLRASLERYGMAMISESKTVTDANSSLVVSAKELNSSLPGTIAHEVSLIKGNYSKKQADEIIPNGADLNNYGNPGFYKGVTDEVLNSPESQRTAFIMRVEGGANEAMIVQVFYAQNGNSYRRTRIDYSHWTSWKNI